MWCWTTDEVPRGDRFDLWQDAICRSIYNVMADCPLPADFRASIRSQDYGPIKVASFHSDEHHISRNARRLREDAEPSYIVSLQVSGVSAISQGEARLRVEADEIAIVHAAKPFEVTFSGSVERLVMVVPSKTLETRIPWLKQRHNLKLGTAAPFGTLVRDHIRELVLSDGISKLDATLLSENVCNLLALATRGMDATKAENEVQFELIASFCRNNLSNPDLSPTLVAAAFGISVRTLHGRFERFGQSFGDWVLERRLDACRQILGDPKRSIRSVSEIVYGAGFNDLSHFCRVFKRRFGLTAREWRTQSTLLN